MYPFCVLLTETVKYAAFVALTFAGSPPEHCMVTTGDFGGPGAATAV